MTPAFLTVNQVQYDPYTLPGAPFLVLAALVSLSLPAFASNQTALVQLVEYVGADYINAVVDGQVVSEEEYAEMAEFTELLAEGVATLPDADGKAALQQQADALQQAVTDKAVEPQDWALAQSIRGTLVSVYGIPVSPKAAPDLARAATLYQTHCAACQWGRARAMALRVPPLSLPPRTSPRSPRAEELAARRLGLHTTITQGVEGTGMAAYGDALGDDDRCCLAARAARR